MGIGVMHNLPLYAGHKPSSQLPAYSGIRIIFMYTGLPYVFLMACIHPLLCV